MAKQERLERLAKAVQNDAAIRRVRRLQPVGGPGDKILPPTYPAPKDSKPEGPRHVFERRRIDGRDVDCVLVDSVQSQANRLEEALQILRAEGKISFPVISVDFEKHLPDLGRISTLEAPHRIFDAIIRDSELGGKAFPTTKEGKKLIEAKPQSAAEVYRLSPTALVFGAWNSTGEGGGLGAKFPRALVSELIGVNVAVDAKGEPSGQRTSSRIDPLGIRASVKVYKSAGGEWSIEKQAKAKEVNPSAANHSNIAPKIDALGVSADYILHSFALSFAALRRLRFKGVHGPTSDADVAARTALAALGMVAAVAQDRAGYFLRSRCDLVPEAGTSGGFEIVRANGETEPFDCTLEEACELLRAASDVARKTGIAWADSDLVLTPQDKLVQLVKLSREKALQGLEDQGEG